MIERVARKAPGARQVDILFGARIYSAFHNVVRLDSRELEKRAWRYWNRRYVLAAVRSSCVPPREVAG